MHQDGILAIIKLIYKNIKNSKDFGKKSLKEIQENFIKGKQKVEILFIIMQI